MHHVLLVLYIYIYLQSLLDKFTYTQIENKQKLLKHFSLHFHKSTNIYLDFLFDFLTHV